MRMISIMFAEETLAFANLTSLLGFKRLPMDQENIFFLYQNQKEVISDTVIQFKNFDRIFIGVTVIQCFVRARDFAC